MAVLKEVIDDSQKSQVKVISISSVQELTEYLNQYSIRNIEKRELCEKCYGIIITLFNERKKALKKATDEIKEIYKLVNDNGMSKN